MYAILESGNVQFRVEEGDTLRIPKIDAEAGEMWTFDRVLLVNDGQETRVGSPHLEGATVTAEVLGNRLGDKVTIFKMKRRATYRLRRGHRQQYTEVRIDKINASG
jgi:large subunit ribosomal protein L21